MKLTDFITYFKNQDAKEIEKDIKISKYIPLNKKMEIINSIDNKLSAIELNRKNSIMFQKQKEMCKFFNILLLYTNIEVDSDSEKTYDECMSCGIDLFIKHYVKNDYERFISIFNDYISIDSSILFRETIMQIGEDNLYDDLKKSFDEISKNKDVLLNLNHILGINKGAV